MIMFSSPPHILSWGRLLTWCVGAGFITLLIACFAPLAGEPLDLLVALRDFSAKGNHSTMDGLIFWQTRLPRVMAGLVAGAGLACSGLAYQAVLRNPLADPYILGVSSGAAIGRAAVVLLLPAATIGTALIAPLMCFAGAIIPILLLMSLARSRRGFSPVTLLLAGAIMNLVLSAAMMLVQVFASPDNARQITYWWLGGLEVTGYMGTAVVALIIAAGITILIIRAQGMNLLSIDALTASHLGLNVNREIFWVLGAGTIMAASAVALCGPIGFAGLLVPHILRLLAGPDNRLLVPLAAFSGAGFLVLCDVTGRRALSWLQAAGLSVQSTAEIPAGVITALIGGPLFLWLLARRSDSFAA